MESIGRNDLVRDEVLSRLLQIERGRFSRDLTFPPSLDPTDRRRITEYTGGITRKRRWLDFVIDQWALNVSSIQPVIRQVLRIGTYELIILDRPPHAVLNASVEQAKRQIKKSRKSAGFVNAVLRTIDRNRDHLPVPNTGSRANDLAILHSHPTWMVERWIKRLGIKSTTALLEWNNARPTFGLRINVLATDLRRFCEKLDRLLVSWRPSRFLNDYVLVDSLQPLVASGLIEDGDFGVQDEAAGLVVSVLDPQPGEFIIDACAAPGGKMIRCAMLMQNEGRVLGVDPNRKRLQMASDAAARHGLSNVEFHSGSFLELELPEGIHPDRILLDVPCSGLGVLARRPDLRWRKEPADFGRLTQLQDRLLDKAADLLRPGGILTYATCTIEPEENSMRVKAFLQRRRDFEVAPVAGLVPIELTDAQGCLATYPHVHQVDGAFAAALRKVK